MTRIIKDYNIEKYIALVFTSFVILTIILRAANSGITYDEAYTYTEYVERIVTSCSLDGARLLLNNHWVNTFLIAVVVKLTGVRYSVILIRLPILVFGIAYYCLVYRFYRNQKISLLQLFVLSSNYYLSEFFGLARGYGMATFFVLSTICLYNKWRESTYTENKYIIYMLGTLLLASYSNSISLLICPAVGLTILIRMDKKDIIPFIKKYMIVILVYCGLYAAIAYWHFLVSADDMPIYSDTGRKYPSIFKYIFDYVGMYTDRSLFIYAFVLIITIIALLTLVIRIKDKLGLFKSDDDIVIIAIILFVVMYLINAVFKKGGCTGRTLLPMFPVFACALFDFVEPLRTKLVSKHKDQVQAGALLAAIALGVIFISNSSITKTSDWMWNYNQNISYRGAYFIDSDNQIDYGWNAVTEFYSQKSQWDIENLLNSSAWKKGCD